MEHIRVIKLLQLPLDDLQPLLIESRSQGFEFLDRLVAEYINGINTFDKAGEALFGAYHDQRLIAIGGLNRDPYTKENDIGRVRHVYVLSEWRNQGIGKLLVEAIIDTARQEFRLLTLRTFRDQADRFYRAIGFQAGLEITSATHYLVLAEWYGN
jgi:GNAT superfamily N-acetyltransferase